jgi:hypothetical protein
MSREKIKKKLTESNMQMYKNLQNYYAKKNARILIKKSYLFSES